MVIPQQLKNEIQESNRRRCVTDGSKLKVIGFIKSGAVKLEDHLDLVNQSYIIAFKNNFQPS